MRFNLRHKTPITAYHVYGLVHACHPKFRQVVPLLPLNGFERLEYNFLWYPHKGMLLIGNRNRIDSKRSHPV